MKKIVYGVIGLFLLCSPLTFAQEGERSAEAVLYNAQGEDVGSAVLTETPGGVEIELELFDLPPGAHAFHIHEAGKCEAPEFTSAGGHFNPYSKQHGAKNPQGAHAGDLPNIEITADGSAMAKVVAGGVTLGNGNNSLLKEGGTALVIHAAADDEMTDPAGNAGARIACGVVAKTEEELE